MSARPSMSRMAPLRAALWSLLLLAGTAQAAGEPLGPATQFTSPDGRPIGAQVERTADGSYALMWHETASSGPVPAGTYVRAFNANGTPRGPAHAVDPFLGADGYNRSPRMVMDANGRFLVAWLDVGIVKGRHFAEDGTPMAPSKLLAPTTIGLLPESWQLAMAPDGSYAVMTHTQTPTPTGASAVVLYRYTPDGRARLPQTVALRPELGLELRLLGLPNYEFQRLDLANRIALDGAGNVVLATLFVTQTRYKPGTAVLRTGTPSERQRGQLQLRRISPNGLPVGRVVTVSTFDTINQPVYLDPVLASAADGRLAVSWFQPEEGLKLWQFSADLTPLAPGQVVSSTTEPSSGSLAIANNGKVVIAWSELRPIPNGWRDMEVHARIYGANGAVLGSVLEPGAHISGSHRAGQVDANVPGEFLLTWGSSFRLPGGGVLNNASTRRYSME